MDENKEKLQDAANDIANNNSAALPPVGEIAPKKDEPKKLDKPKEPKKEEKTLIARCQTWIKEIVAEFHKVVWPNKKDLSKMTVTVIITSLIFGVLIAGLDSAFRFVVGVLVRL